MNTHDYTRSAHRRTIWAALQRHLMELYVDGDTPPKDTLVCEEVFFADREVSQESLMEAIEGLQRLEADERVQMDQFEFMRRHVDKSATPPAAQTHHEEPPRKNVIIKREFRKEPVRGAASKKA